MLPGRLGFRVGSRKEVAERRHKGNDYEENDKALKKTVPQEVEA